MKPFYIFVAIFVQFVTGFATEVKVKPIKYHVKIQTSEKDFKDSDEVLKFQGKVTISFSTFPENIKSFNYLLNVIPETETGKLELKGHFNGTLEPIGNVTLEHVKNFVNVTVNIDSLKEYDYYEMVLPFLNPYQNDMSGFYRSYYYTPEGQKRWLLTTQFEPIYARKAFPCFDDPSLKASFVTSISYPKTLTEYNVLCNTNIFKVFEENDLKVVICNETIPMSTYLVAFAVTDFKNTETVHFNSTYPENLPIQRNLTTYGRKSLIDAGDGKLSLESGKEAVRLLTEYLEKGYAFPKIDFIGIPDFSAGAMENWGLITYREKILFYNEEKGTAPMKQSNVLTVVHELVHQWFGNLVTLKSWDYIWLNEAFANYISYVIADQIKIFTSGDWEYMKQLLNKEVHLRALEVDGLAGARALSQELKDESLISPAFDDIPYAKGASILRMWDLSLGKDMFRKSLVHYVDKNAEKSVGPHDLYVSLRDVGKMDEDFFNSWHENPGYPVIDVKKKNGSMYTLSQSRFFWEKSSNSSQEVEYVVPITYTEANSVSNFDTVPKTWLRNKSIELSITGKWFIINNQQAGYYRVNYENENWMALSKALAEPDFSRIHELNRAQIINDVFSLARSMYKNFVSYDVALNLSRFLKNETSYVVWKSAFHAFNFLLSKLSQETVISNKLKEYVLDLMKPHFKPLNESSSQQVDRLKTSLMAQWACALDYEPCLKSARDLHSNASKYPDVEEVILCNYVKTDNKAWDEIFEIYKKELESSKKIMYLSVLGCTTKEETLQHYLNFTISNDTAIRKQDRSFALASVYKGNAKHVEIAFKFIENNYKAIVTGFGESNALGKALNGIAKNLHSKDDISRMEKLTNTIKEDTTVKVPLESLKSAVSIVKNNRDWVSERALQIKSYFNSSSALSYSILILFVSTLASFEF